MEPDLDPGPEPDDGLGPAFDPDAAAAAPPPVLDAALAGGENWSASRIRSILQAQGALVHGALAVDKAGEEWLYTSADLDAIAPPLARLMNRYPATRAAAAGGDELAVAIGLAGYAARSYSQRRAAQHAARLLAEPGADPQPNADAIAEPEPMRTAEDAAWPDHGETPPITGRR